MKTEEPHAGWAVGVIGLGAMGGPIADHLIDADLAVAVLDHDPAAVQLRARRGAAVAQSPAQLAASVNVVLVIVPSDADALAVCLGPEGVLAGAVEGGTILLCSSLRPQTCHRIADATPSYVDVLDAALTGGVRGAETGEINLLVGGNGEALERVRPVLTPWCAEVHHLGGLGAGQVGKTVNNLVHWAQISAIAEAFSLGAAYGLDIPTLRRALSHGPTDSRTLRELERMRLTWHVKDLANAAAMADAVGVALPMAESSRRAMLQLSVESLADLLTTTEDPDRLRRIAPEAHSGTAPEGHSATQTSHTAPERRSAR